MVLKTQELAGIDVAADGELSRFSVNHPETNGMIDYFVAPLDGVETQLSREEYCGISRTGGYVLPRQTGRCGTRPDLGKANWICQALGNL